MTPFGFNKYVSCFRVSCYVRAMLPAKGLEHKFNKEWQSRPGEKEAGGDLIIPQNSLTGGGR